MGSSRPHTRVFEPGFARARTQQQARHLRVALAARDVQRRLPAVGGLPDRRPGAEQQPGDRLEAAFARHLARARAAGAFIGMLQREVRLEHFSRVEFGSCRLVL